MTASAYIHIPFCKSKCKYCSFVSYINKNAQQQNEYTDILLKEIEYYYQKEPLKTLYFGGGTPSLMEIKDLKRIVECFNFDKNAEITIEINPETVDNHYLSQLYKMGFNRLSTGVQTFDDKILKNIGRIHSSKKALNAVKQAQKAGFKNISVDFIYGLPEQTIGGFINDLKMALTLNIQHISLYGLKIEEGCVFYKFPPPYIADDDVQADMYLAAIEILEQNGFNHYEISNFARKGFESKHNLNYWNDEHYYGFGAAAHGYIDGTRYANYRGIKGYSEKFTEKEFVEKIGREKQLEEMIFLGFRKSEGIDVKKINKVFLIDFEKEYEYIIKKYLNTGHLIKTQNGYRLSNEGFLISNIILSDFIDC